MKTKEKFNKCLPPSYIGSSFDTFLEEQGILEEVNVEVAKRIKKLKAKRIRNGEVVLRVGKDNG